jgi:hypothetical protein
MSLLRRTPREVYRLYAEDEYLAGATWESSAEPASTTGASDLRRRRALSAAILLGAMGAVGSLLALNSISQPRAAGRRMAHRSTSTSRVPPTWKPETRVRRVDARGSAIRVNARHARRSAALTVAAVAPARQTATAFVASARARPVEFGFER